MSNFSKSFECPAGFTEEQVLGQLYLEDVDDDSELWLIRMPSDIELSGLDKKKIFLSDEYSNTFETEGGKLLECFVDNCKIPNLCTVLPGKNDNKLHEVKKVFKGSILVTEGMRFTDPQVIKCEIEDEPTNSMNDSSSTTLQPKKKSKKKKSRIPEEDLYNTEDGDNRDFSQTKRHSHSKKSIVSEEVKNELPLSDRDEFPYCNSQI